MNRHGHSTDRVRGGGEFGAVWPGVEGRRHCNVSVVAGVVVVLGVLVVVVSVFVWLAFRSFRFVVFLEARNRNSFSTWSSS